MFTIVIKNMSGSTISVPTKHMDEVTSKIRGPKNLAFKDLLSRNLRSMDGHTRSLDLCSMRDLDHTLRSLGYSDRIQYLTGGHLTSAPVTPIPPGAIS